MRLSLALAALVAVVPAFANVIHPQARDGLIIPLRKRGVGMKNANGVANRQALKSSTNSIIKKMMRISVPYPRSAEEASATGLSAHAIERDDGSGGAPIINEVDLYWQALISVGTPPVNYTVDIETDSSDLILPGTSCGASCQGHKIYDTAASSSAKDLGKSFTLGFGDGPPISGEVFTDTVTLAGLTATNQSIGVASHYSDDLSSPDFPPDGIIGLGFPEFSGTGLTFMENLVEQRVVEVSQFSLKLAEENAELYLGGANPDLFTGEFTTANVTQHGEWQIIIESVNAEGQQVIGPVQALILIGAPAIVAPRQDVVQFYRAIPGSKDASDTVRSGFFTIPCDTDPQVSFTFGGKQFEIPVTSFILGPVDLGSTDCIGGIAGSDDVSIWVVGDTFLRNFYTTFDFDAGQVGFADLA